MTTTKGLLKKEELIFFKCSFCKKLLPGNPPHRVEYWDDIGGDWEWQTYFLSCRECLPKLEGVFRKEGSA